MAKVDFDSLNTRPFIGPLPGGMATTGCHACVARAFSICNTVPEHQLQRLDQLSSKQEVSAGQEFVFEGAPAGTAFNIVIGAVKLQKLMSDGRRQIIGFIGAGDFIGIGDDEAYGFAAEALTDLKMCAFRRRDLDRLFEEFPELQRKVYDLASHELNEAREQMLLLGRKTATEKIASFIVGRANRQWRCGADDTIVHLPMMRADIADFLGLTPESVSRVLTKLRQEGVIELTGVQKQNVRIVNRDALNDISGVVPGGH